METQKNLKFIIWAMAAHGVGISGGDKIFIEFARYWSKTYPVTIYLWQEGFLMCQRQKLDRANIKYQVSRMKDRKTFGFVINYFTRIVESIKIALILRLESNQNTIIYSASEFWMDSLPAFILKLRYPKIRWVAAWYQTAPKPWIGFSEGKRDNKYFLAALVYWLMQFPIKSLINNFADFVFVNNDNEKKIFGKLNHNDKTITVLGAVDLQSIELFTKRYPLKTKKYDAVFQGRFHPQKGVLELVDIWKLVVGTNPDAKLVMIGDGALMKNVKFKVKSLKLENNIILTGYLFDGFEKHSIFTQSKIVLHPSLYDSGGMAALEAMAFGLPCVGFNLKSYNDYYPKGMEKVPTGDLEAFSKKVLKLLSDKKFYAKISRNALTLTRNMSWEKRARQILDRVLE